VSLLSVVPAPFAGAYDLLGIDYHYRPVEVLSEHVSDQGSGCGMVTMDPTMDIAQQMLPLFEGNATLQEPSVASLVEFTLHKNKGLGAMCEPSSLRPIRRQCVMEEVVEVERSLVD